MTDLVHMRRSRAAGTPADERVHGARAVIKERHVWAHAIQREIGAKAEASEPNPRQIPNSSDGDRIDVRVHVRMTKPFRMEAESEDLLAHLLGAAVHGGCAGREEVGLEQIAERDPP